MVGGWWVGQHKRGWLPLGCGNVSLPSFSTSRESWLEEPQACSGGGLEPSTLHSLSTHSSSTITSASSQPSSTSPPSTSPSTFPSTASSTTTPSSDPSPPFSPFSSPSPTLSFSGRHAGKVRDKKGDEEDQGSGVGGTRDRWSRERRSENV